MLPMAPLGIKIILNVHYMWKYRSRKKVKRKLPHHTQNTLLDWEIQPVQKILSNKIIFSYYASKL